MESMQKQISESHSNFTQVFKILMLMCFRQKVIAYMHLISELSIYLLSVYGMLML